ncbi:MAG TPA: dTDP-4-dehydrorhamnose 3,5-epimerase [Flavitalea sp.]|nr:dTDP-4-dehydrorhamnose 3,5-epimerase [Flavitalea sp.]
MLFTPTGLAGLIVVEPKVFEDDRGYFFEAYSHKNFSSEGIAVDFVQDNQSKSGYGVVRGLHYQKPPYAQSKLVRVLSGAILDVAVDIRRGSPGFGKAFLIELSAENKKQLFIPVGFAHGFSVISETAEVLYKCDAFYNKQSEGGIVYNDPGLSIDWGIPPDKIIVSEKDRLLPTFEACAGDFTYSG